jgi:prepilin-type N-terminal cleavage/methylation domain-containing protein
MAHHDMRSERGFSLVEMLITLTVTLVIMAGAFRAYDDGRKVVAAGTTLADVNQDLRSTVNLISRDLIQTGRELPNGGIPMPSGTGSVPVLRPGPLGPTGGGLTFPVSFDGVLPAICPGPDLGPVINGVTTDILTNLMADSTLALNQYPLASVQADGSRMTVDARTNINDAATGLRAGDLIWFTNAVGDAIQTVTRVQGQDVYFDANDPFLFNQRTAAAGTILNIKSGTTFPPTSATRVIMITYYIDAVSVPGQFRLTRQVGFGTPRLIAMGIDNMQVTYDIVDGVTNPVNQPDAVDPYNPVQIRKVNLFLAGRSELRTTQTQAPLRLSVATQVSLRAMSFVDRYQ